MTAPRTESLQSQLETLIALARLLERVEASPVAVGADQYRALVERIKAALAAPLPCRCRRSWSAHPATGEIYENMNYEISGLSRSPLERSVATEMLATQLSSQVHAGGAARLNGSPLCASVFPLIRGGGPCAGRVRYSLTCLSRDRSLPCPSRPS